jgi:hypothetical protein
MTQSTTARAWATGGLIFAATMLLTVGTWQVLVGIAALVEDEFFIVTPNYTYDIDTTAWGWTHLGVGVLLAVTGLFLLTGAAWARVAGIVLAALSAIANFLFLPYYPLWSLVIIALDVWVIWALATGWRQRDQQIGSGTADYRTAGSRPGGDERPGGEEWSPPARPGAAATRNPRAGPP